MANQDNALTLKELLAAGDLKTKLLAVLPTLLSNDKKETLLRQISEGKTVKEVHTKAGLKNDPPHQFEKCQCLTGHMTLPATGEWTCFAVWSRGNRLFQGTFRLKLDPDPSQTVLALQIASPPGTAATTFSVIDSYFKVDTDGKNAALTIAGELGVSYRDSQDQLRTLIFTTEANQVVGL